MVFRSGGPGVRIEVTISCEVDVTSATVELTTDDGSLAVDKGCEVEGCEVDDLCIVP